MSRTKTTQVLPIGQWLPDDGDTYNAGSINVENALVQGEHYKPLKDFQTVGTAVSTSTRVYGAYSFIDKDLNVVNIAADQYELYKQNGTSWDNVSVTSTETNTYNTASDGHWRFTSHGQRIMATNFADEIQSYVVGTSTAFSILSTAAPKARDIAVLNNFVVAVNLDDGTKRPNRVHWSALDDPTDWSTSAVTLSDYQDLQDDGGPIQRIVPAQDYGVLMRENSIERMEFIGSPGIFQFNRAERLRGTKAANSVVSDGVFVYYLAEDGFYAFDGTKSIPIGDNKVDRFFLDNIDSNRLEVVKAAVNPIEKYIVWGFKNTAKNGNITDLLFYHWTEQRWTQGFENLDYLETIYTTGLTLEQLDAQSTSIETLAYSLDSRVWQGGKATLGGFSTGQKLGFFDGNNKKAVFETSETQLNNDGRAFLESVVAVTDSTGVTARIKHRTNQYSAVTVTSSATFNTNTNEIPFRIDDIYHRVEFTIAAGSTWELFKGFKFRYQGGGAR